MTVAATRTDRDKHRQSAARAVAAARGRRNDRTWIIVGIVAVIVVAGAVIGGVIFQKNRSTPSAQDAIPAQTVAGSTKYPATIDRANATVLVGKPTAKVAIDAYEDFLCPICGEFEAANFTGVEQQLEAGTVKVRYHMLNLLDSRSTPPGYSMLAANTALAVATVAPEKFIDFHYSLYQKQPQEEGVGWTQSQLTSLANRLGVTGSVFDGLVANKTYDGQIQAEPDQRREQPVTVGNGLGWQQRLWYSDDRRQRCSGELAGHYLADRLGPFGLSTEMTPAR